MARSQEAETRRRDSSFHNEGRSLPVIRPQKVDETTFSGILIQIERDTGVKLPVPPNDKR